MKHADEIMQICNESLKKKEEEALRLVEASGILEYIEQQFVEAASRGEHTVEIPVATLANISRRCLLGEDSVSFSYWKAQTFDKDQKQFFDAVWFLLERYGYSHEQSKPNSGLVRLSAWGK